ncbi:hypothetical protein KC19_8G112400 [Ceratodon purpureus]|uniref:Uncharacterized protein n=1 Tax=Ceratodon purpureus TaxID=3225 RepID=A0A8T0H291_CERPU|nr:hypothetical protein KC19_8G112400 [Ceratodon purpureus]
MVASLLVINFILYVISAAIAGLLLNKGFNGGFGFGNTVTQIFLFVLVASMVGIASTLAGAHHLRIWSIESLAAAAAAATIAWTLTLLAMGVACKEIHTRYGRNKRLKTLEAFMIILSLFELLYLLALDAGHVTREGYANIAATPKNPTYGTPAATAV